MGKTLPDLEVMEMEKILLAMMMTVVTIMMVTMMI